MIEQWLCVLEAEMQTSVREVCRSGADDLAKPLKDFCSEPPQGYPSQVSLLGV